MTEERNVIYYLLGTALTPALDRAFVERGIVFRPISEVPSAMPLANGLACSIWFYEPLRHPLAMWRLKKRLAASGIPLLAWNRDAPHYLNRKNWRLDLLDRSRLLDVYASHSLIDDRSFADHVLYLPNAADVDVYNLGEGEEQVFRRLREPQNYLYDVSFFGAMDGQREKECLARGEFFAALGESLRARNIRFLFRETKGMSVAEQIRLIQTSRINLNFGALCDYGAPVASGFPERCYGIPACGGFLLCDKRTHARDDFSIGENWAEFDGLDDCVVQIEHWLAHFDQARDLAERCHRHVIGLAWRAEEMNEPLLSVVIPVYNVEAYLRQCLDSLIAQTHVIDEIIAVDDGSTDSCPAILEEYASRLPQLRIIRQQNSGQAVARNTGIKLARGRYLAFVDSDDFVAPQMYERLLAMAEADKLEIALCNALFHFEGRQPDRQIYPNVATTDLISGKAWLRERLKNDHLLHMVWMHLYRRDFLTEHDFSFPAGMVYEDVIWTTEVLLQAKRVRYDATPLYFYRISVRHFPLEQNRRRLEAIITSSIINAKRMSEFADEYRNDEELSRLLRWLAVDGAFSIFHKIEKLPDSVWRNARYHEVRASKLFPLLWKNAVDWRQRRRIARNYLKCVFAGAVNG
jgi:spore maturation protein CgeB